MSRKVRDFYRKSRPKARSSDPTSRIVGRLRTNASNFSKIKENVLPKAHRCFGSSIVAREGQRGATSAIAAMWRSSFRNP